MAIKSSNQITITDITDAYSVILSSEAFTIAGGVSGATSGSCKTSVMAMRGGAATRPSVTESDITFTTATGTASSVLTASVDATTNPDVPEITFSIVSGQTLSETIEATIPVKLANNTITITKKFSFGVAKTGEPGTAGATWASGTAITGTAATGNTGYAGKVGDQYVNTNTWNVYTCATEGTASGTGAAQWNKTGNIKGGPGTAGAKWYQGTGTPASGTGVNGDYYLNTSNGDVYTKSSNAWSKTGNIKGISGDDAILITITTDNGDCFKNSEGNTIMTPNVYVGGEAKTLSTTSTVGKYQLTIGSTNYYLYWYAVVNGVDTKLTSSNTGSAAGKYGEFINTSPYGRLKVYATQVADKQAYTCKIEDA